MIDEETREGQQATGEEDDAVAQTSDEDTTQGGADSGEQAADESDEQSPAGSGDDSEGEPNEEEDPAAVVEKLEDDPPQNLEDWPQGKAKYETFGGPEGEHGYHEGPEENLGPSSVRHLEDGRVTVAGEEVDNPDEYKSEPVPGGPTDPNSPDAPGEKADEEGADTEGDEQGGAQEASGSEEPGESEDQ